MPLPRNIFFLTDFYLAKKEQIKPRLKAAQLAKELGFERFGGEFLFMHIRDAQDLKEQEKQGIQVKEKLDSWFDHTYFSVHAPWWPFQETAFELGKKQLGTIQKLLDFFPDFVEIINVHTGTVPLEYWNQKLKNNPGQKQKNFEIVKQQLESLADLDDRLCVENLFAPLTEEDGANYLANLPSDLVKMAGHRKIGITIDTAHAGMTIESCKKMARSRELLDGFFEDEWSEIWKVAKNGKKEFINFGKKIGHIHFNDFAFEKKEPWDGAAPGMGATPEKELFEWLDALIEASGKKRIGATIEVKEKEYRDLANQKKSMENIARYYGL